MRFDLHTHSRCSDGTLTPADLVAHAAQHGVELLALTDHDSFAGCKEAADACAAQGMRFVPGIELSTTWRGQAVHVIGLGLAGERAELERQIADVHARRRARIAEIGARLTRRARLPGEDIVRPLLADTAVPTRMHVARRLVALGHAANVQEAFDRWLKAGRPGHTPAEWPALASAIDALAGCGAQVVLAHPHRYRLSAGALRNLVTEFKAAGGHALEVSIGGMSRNDLDRLATLARRAALAASAGSDFHDPTVPWNPPGRFAKLPADLEPIVARL